MMTLMQSIETMDPQLWAKTEQRGDCRIWTGAIDPKGYGILIRKNKRWLVHRYAYQLSTGKPINNLCVSHICGNRSCVKKKHLIIGTHAENVKTMMKKKFEGLIRYLCPKCRSSQTMARKVDRKRWCRSCLHEWPVDATQKKQGATK